MQCQGCGWSWCSGAQYPGLTDALKRGVSWHRRSYRPLSGKRGAGSCSCWLYDAEMFRELRPAAQLAFSPQLCKICQPPHAPCLTPPGKLAEHPRAMDTCDYPEPSQHGRDPPLEVVPALVALVDHLLELAGRVCAVLPRQAPVLLVDELQLREPLVDLPLEGLQHRGEQGLPPRPAPPSTTCCCTWLTPPA